MTLYIVAGLVVAIGLGALYLLRLGGRKERLRNAERTVDVQREQLEVANDRPGSPVDLARRLREFDGR